VEFVAYDQRERQKESGGVRQWTMPVFSLGYENLKKSAFCSLESFLRHHFENCRLLWQAELRKQHSGETPWSLIAVGGSFVLERTRMTSSWQQALASRRLGYRDDLPMLVHHPQSLQTQWLDYARCVGGVAPAGWS
jgi:hypothetical protein